MTSTHFLGLLALALAVSGLAAVIVEAAVKQPSILVELVVGGRAAIAAEGRPAAGRAVIGYREPRAAANSVRRAAA